MELFQERLACKPGLKYNELRRAGCFGMLKNTETKLSDWYLARLRKEAAKVNESRLTPHALVETDYNLIRKLVERSVPTREGKTEQILGVLEKSDNYLKVIQISIYVATASSLALLLFMLH